MAVSMTKRSYYPIMVRTSKPNNEGGQTQRRTRFHSADAASIAADNRVKAGHTLEHIGYVTDPK